MIGLDVDGGVEVGFVAEGFDDSDGCISVDDGFADVDICCADFESIGTKFPSGFDDSNVDLYATLSSESD